MVHIRTVRNRKILERSRPHKFNGTYARRSHVTPSVQLYLIQAIKIPKGITRPDYVTTRMNSPDLLLGIRNLLHWRTVKSKRYTCTGEIMTVRSTEDSLKDRSALKIHGKLMERYGIIECAFNWQKTDKLWYALSNEMILLIRDSTGRFVGTGRWSKSAWNVFDESESEALIWVLHIYPWSRFVETVLNKRKTLVFCKANGT